MKTTKGTLILLGIVLVLGFAFIAARERIETQQKIDVVDQLSIEGKWKLINKEAAFFAGSIYEFEKNGIVRASLKDKTWSEIPYKIKGGKLYLDGDAFDYEMTKDTLKITDLDEHFSIILERVGY